MTRSYCFGYPNGDHAFDNPSCSSKQANHGYFVTGRGTMVWFLGVGSRLGV